MSEHISLEQLNSLLNHTLAERHLLQCLKHLNACPLCRAQVNSRREQLMNFTDELTELPTHLEFEQLSAYVLGGIDAVTREIADNHLASCTFCAGEVQALTLLQTELQQLRAPERAVQASPAAPWWVNFRQQWRLALEGSLGARPSLAFAAGTLLLLVSLSGWVWWREQSRPDTRAESAQTAPSPALPTTTTGLEATNSNNTDLLALVDHGQTISLRQDGNLSAPLELPAPYETLLQQTLANQRLPLPEQLKQLAPSPNTLKSITPETNTFQVIAPLRQVVQSARPVFRWQAQPEAASYEVAVFDEDFNPVLTSEPLTQTTWQASQPLPRGHVYLWQVTAKVGELSVTTPLAPAPEARFQVLSQPKAQELRQARNTYSQSHLLLGALYAQAGLLDESERELRALQQENPQQPLVSQLLQQIRQARGQNQ